MRELEFSGPATSKAVKAAISQDLDDLGFVVGKEFIYGPRCSGRTTKLLEEALHQLDFMDPGDEIWILSPRMQDAKMLCEHVGNHMAEEMGFEREDFMGPYHNAKTKASVLGLGPACRYFLTFKEDKHIHFCTIDALPKQLIGRRLTYSPCIFIDHICYEFGTIQESPHDLYDALQNAV